MAQNTNYPTAISSLGTCCKKYKIYFMVYGLVTLLLNMIMLSYCIILSYNYSVGTLELRLINKAMIPKMDGNYSYKFSYTLERR